MEKVFENCHCSIRAIRLPSESSTSQAAFMYCSLSSSSSSSNDAVICIQEDAGMVDGIGGTNWDGALVVAATLESWLQEMQCSLPLPLLPLRVMELGCGAGLLSIVSRVLHDNSFVVMTDQEDDLARSNADSVIVSKSTSISASTSALKQTLSMLAARRAQIKSETGTGSAICARGDWDGTLITAPLAWGEKGFPVCDALLQEDQTNSHDHAHINAKMPDLLIGAEIAVLYKQQPLLCQTIDRLAGPHTLVLLSIDDFPKEDAPPSTESNTHHKTNVARSGGPPREGYAVMLDNDMHRRGFLKKVVTVLGVRWRKLRDLSSLSGSVAGADVDGVFNKDILGTLFTEETATEGGHEMFSRTEVALVHQAGTSFPVDDSSCVSESAYTSLVASAIAPTLQAQEVHHICAYYRPPLLALALAHSGAKAKAADADVGKEKEKVEIGVVVEEETCLSPLLTSPSLLRSVFGIV